MFDRDGTVGVTRASNGEGAIRVLCVGPETSAVERVTERLEDAHERLSTAVAASVSDVIDTLEDGVVDCIVSGHRLPELDGVGLLEQVRRVDDAIPFVLFTANGSEATASAAVEHGVSGYLRDCGDGDQYTVLSARIEAVVDEYREAARLKERKAGFELAETLFNNTQDALFVVDVREEPFRLERVNPAYETLTGLSNESLRGQTLTDVFGEHDGANILRQYRACVEECAPIEYEEEVSVPSSGPYWDTRISPVIVSGRVEKLVGATRNITEQKREQQALERTEEFLMQIQQVADIGGWEVNERTGRMRWTAELYRIHGLTPEDEPTVADGIGFYHPDDRETIRTAYERLSAEGDPYDLELRLRTDDGERRWVRARGKPWYEDGERVGARGTLQDSTERKQYENELERTNERLESFASVVSHDLRNPLVVAQGSLELYRERRADEDIERVVAAHERIDALITGLLALARDGRQVTETVPVALAEQVEAAFEMIPTHRATLEVAVGEYTLGADEARLRQLLENLLSNAIRHGGDGVGIRVDLLDGDAGFYVADDGPGIPAAQREQVFDHGYSTGKEGTGLGLAIVESIATAHGWQVDATESVDGGARFEVRTE